MPTRKRKTGIADKVEYDSLGKKRSALWLKVVFSLVRQALVRRGQQSYLLEGSLLLLLNSWAAVKKKEETFNQCFRAKSFCEKLVLSYS